MRIRNRELRSRRHRKEQKIKDADRALRLQYGEKSAAAAAKPVVKAKAAPAKKAPAKKKAEPA